MEMEYNRLGNSGLKVSRLSFGAWVTFGDQIDEDAAEACMKHAYEAGVNFFDNAEAYANGQAEVVMGSILKKMQWPRDSFLVSSKVFFGSERRGPNQRGLSRKHVIEACHAAMGRLQVDYLDLYFCHRPDPETPIEETVRAMNTLIEQGKILYWGTSEWSARDIQEAKGIAESYHLIGPTMEQPQYNMFHRDRLEHEYAPLYDSKGGLGTTIWSPLASGLLTGKYNQGIPQDSRLGQHSMNWLKEALTKDEELWRQKLEKVRKLGELAGELGIKLPAMAIAWCASNPRVSTVITGASRPEQVQENMKALEALPLLTDEVMERIESILNEKA